MNTPTPETDEEISLQIESDDWNRSRAKRVAEGME